MSRLAAILCSVVFAVTVVSASTSARADDTIYTPTTLTAMQILHDARKASGDLADGAYERIERTHRGGMDSVTTAYLSGDDYVSDSVRGPFTSAWGGYKGQNWNQDANGLVTLETNFHVAENPDDRALEHPEDPANRVTVLGITQGPTPAYAVDVNPPDGEHQIRYYEVSTFHLLRVVRWSSDRLKHATTYSDYRTAFGDTSAYDRRSSDGRPDNDSETTITSFTKLTAAPDMRIPLSRSLFTFASLQPVVLPATFHGNAIIVRLNINGRGLDFMLDSGSTDILIDPGVARQLGLKLYGKFSGTMGGSFDLSQTIVPLATIGNVQLKNAVFGVAPIGEEDGGARVVGLLGYDFFASAVIGINFKNQTVTAYPRGTIPTHDPVSEIPAQLDDGVPRVTASFEGVTGHFLLDLGAFRTLLYPSYLAKLPNKINVQQNVGATFVGGNETMSQYTVHDFIFGGVKFGSATLMVPQNSLADMREYDGIIGRDVLEGYALYFDYGRQAIFAKYEQ